MTSRPSAAIGLVVGFMLAACAKPLPPGVARLTPRDSGLQSFVWSPSSRRLAYVEGRFPSRTYLVIADRATGKRTRERVSGFVLGRGLALSRDGSRALLDAGKITHSASRNEPVERVLLLVEANGGRVLEQEVVGNNAVLSLAQPAWASGPVAAWNGRDGPVWKTFGAVGERGSLQGPPAWKGLLLDEPFLVVSGRSAQPPRLAAFDLRTGRAAHDWTAALSIVALGPALHGGVLSARWVPETGHFALEVCDPVSGSRKVMLEADGEIESAVETERGLFAIAKDTTRRNGTGKDFLAPRVLLAIEAGGARWSVPWSFHQGAFLGADPVDGRLIFAVTDRDRPGVWAVEPTPAALTAAGAAIDL